MKRLLSIFVTAMLILLVFAGCGGAKSDVENSLPGEQFYDQTVTDTTTPVSDRKLIKTVRISVETENYDTFLATLNEQITNNGGYIEASDENLRNDKRSAELTIRIPADKTDTITNEISNGATITRKSESTDDVTETYVDISARLKVLKAEEESLILLLNSASNITEIITVRERLTATRSEIESFEARLKTLENKISYSTITLSITEVLRETENEGYFASIGANILDGFKNVGQGITAFIAFILSAIPYLLVPGITLFIVLFVIKLNKKKAAKKEDKN